MLLASLYGFDEEIGSNTLDVHIQPDRTMTITQGMKANP